MISAKLRIVGGTEGKKVIPLRLPATVGRGSNCDIALPEPLVSRKHCEIFAMGDQLYVRDLGSTNGTYVGSTKIDSDYPLNPGELLTIGTVTMRALYGNSIETDASGFLSPNPNLDEETVNLVEDHTVVDSGTSGERPRGDQVGIDAES